MKKALIINAHLRYEGIAEGKLNASLASEIKAQLQNKGYEVKETYIEKGYDVDDEIAKHEWADLIITQSPVYDFSTPWTHKKYIDSVFISALTQKRLVESDGRTRKDPSKQYGSGGLMQGKKFMLSLTWNAPREAFDDESQVLYAGKSVDDAFLHVTTGYKFCSAEILPAFACFNVMKGIDYDGDVKRLHDHLQQYCD